jgi:hypothetical protein
MTAISEAGITFPAKIFSPVFALLRLVPRHLLSMLPAALQLGRWTYNKFFSRVAARKIFKNSP